MNMLNGIVIPAIISSSVVYVLTIVYFFIRKVNIIKLEGNYLNLDLFASKLRWISAGMIILFILLLLPSIFKIENKNDELTKDVIKSINENTKYLENDSLFVLNGLSISIPRGYTTSEELQVAESSNAFYFQKEESLKKLRIILLSEILTESYSYEFYIKSMVEILGESGDYEFTYSDIDSKYKECYIRDYKGISDKNIEKQGTVIILYPDYSVGKDNIFYSINFEG